MQFLVISVNMLPLPREPLWKTLIDAIIKKMCLKNNVQSFHDITLHLLFQLQN